MAALPVTPRIEQCASCTVRAQSVFCNLPDNAIKALDSIRFAMEFPKGTTLFHEGEPVRGVYVICYGRAKLSATSTEGKLVILRLVEPGEIAGLTGLFSDGRYHATVETTEPTQANFIRRDDFLRFINQFHQASLNVTHQLAQSCTCAYEEVRSFAFSGSVAEKVARLLLQWARAGKDRQPPRIRMRFTQVEMAQMIGSSRESVSRQLAEFREQGLISIKGSLLTVRDLKRLEELVT